MSISDRGRCGFPMAWTVLAMFFAATASLVGCGEEEAPPPPVVRPVKILELGADSDDAVLEFPGRVEAGQSATLAFEVAGRILELEATEGQEVTRTTLLARLDPRDFQAKLDAELAKLRAAEAEYERARELFRQSVTSRQELESKQRNFEVVETSVTRARKALEDTRLEAPFDGVVARVDVKRYENVQAKQPVLVIENDSVFQVVADVPEQDAARMSPGLDLAERTARGRPEIVVSALDGRRFPARLTEFATTADPRTRTFAATLQFDNPGDVSLASGMTANVRIHVPPEIVGGTGLYVPSVAVASSPEGDPIVWVIDPDTLTATARKVEIGTLSGDRVRVTRGLEGDEWIAVSGVAFLHEGMVVSRATN